jgi:serine/threonine protein kinase
MSEESSKKTDPLVGKIIGGRYECMSLLGKGGMGKVFKVKHVDLEKVFAMKTLHLHLTHDQATVERFKREAKAASKIGCENIIEMIDYGEDPEAGHYFVMEFLEGDDLSKRIKKYGPMHYTETCHVLLQICDALAAVHKEGIIHRDLKPENIVLVDKDRRVDIAKILDFGIAAMKTQYEEGAERLTQAGTIFGTPTYMSPEQAYGMDLDNRTDIYSLGCILYEMMTGFVPFKADHPLQVLDMHLNVPPTPPSVVRPDLSIPPPMEAIILRAMAKDKNERYQSTVEIQQAVLSFYQPGVTPITSHRGNAPLPSGGMGQASATLAQPRIGGSGAPAPLTSAMTSYPQEASPKSKRTLVLMGIAATLIAVVAALVFVLKSKEVDTGGLQKKDIASAQQEQQEMEKRRADRQAREREREREMQELAQKAAEEAARQAKAEMAAQQPAAAKEITLTFSSDPAGASVLLNGALVGVTPFERAFPISDSHTTFTVKKDEYDDGEIKVAMNTTQTVSVALVKAAPVAVAAKKTGGSGGGGTKKAGGDGGGGKKTGGDGGQKSGGGGTPLRLSDDFQ